MNNNSQNHILTIEQAVEKTYATIHALRYAVRTSRIPYLKIKGRVYFAVDDLEGWLESRRKALKAVLTLRQLREEQKSISRKLKAIKRDFKRRWVK